MGLALVPTLFHEDNKPTFLSSVWTGCLLVILSATFATLDLWGSAASSAFVSIIWLILAYQRYGINKREGKPIVNIPHWLPFIIPPM